MKDLLININDNYNMNIKNIRKLGITTINDIFVINSSSKKYIVKIYNVDEEKQIYTTIFCISRESFLCILFWLPFLLNFNSTNIR